MEAISENEDIVEHHTMVGREQIIFCTNSELNAIALQANFTQLHTT